MNDANAMLQAALSTSIVELGKNVLARCFTGLERQEKVRVLVTLCECDEIKSRDPCLFPITDED